MTAVPTISVVIPCFDYERFVASAIESVLANDRAPDELIVVDDGSTDGSASVVERYEEVTLVRKENGGMASALNRGIAEATGEVIVLLDADDLAAPGRLRWVESAFADPDVAMAWHPLVVEDASGTSRGHLPASPLPSGDLVGSLVEEGFSSFAVTSGVAVRRSVLLAMGPIPEDEFKNFAESFVIRSAPFHGRVVATDEPLGVYRVHGGSDMRRALSDDPDEMAVKLASRLRMADTEQRLLCRLAEQRGVHLTPGMLHARDAVYRDLHLAHGRLAERTRGAGWSHGRRLDLDGASPVVRVGAAVRLATYVALPRRAVARHQLVRSGASGLSGVTRLWSVLYWRTRGLVGR